MSKKAKKTTPKKKTTALAVRRPAAPARQQAQPELLPPDNTALMNVLGDSPALGTLGTEEVQLTEKEERELSTGVDPTEVLVKPTGQPYLPHAQYRRWFIRAFGRLGWSLVAKAKPVKVPLPKKDAKEGEATTRHVVMVPFMLYVHQKPVAFAWGEQEFNETNAEQTYGDAVEACAGSALRRCAKALGVGLELWDRDWLSSWLAQYAIAVRVNGYTKWRRKVDPPLPGEQKGNPNREGPGQPPPQRQSFGDDGNGDALITQPQRQRLATIAKKAGRETSEVSLWLKKKWGYNGSAQIKRKDYDAICRELEAKGELTMPGDGDVVQGEVVE